MTIWSEGGRTEGGGNIYYLLILRLLLLLRGTLTQLVRGAFGLRGAESVSSWGALLELCWGPVRQSGRLLRALRRLPGPISKSSLAFLGFRGPSCPSPPRESQGLWRSPEVRGNLQGQEEVHEELTLSACAALQSVRWFGPPGGSRV